MKRSLLCLFMAAAILIGVISVTPTSARAASNMKLSDAGIAFIKEWEGFLEFPQWDHSQWTVGYGTRCPDADLERLKADGITEDEALALLASEIASFETELNEFIDRHSLTYTQQQFDAVLSLIFNCGGNWLKKGETLINALTNNVSDNELIFAFVIYSMSDGVRSKGHIIRRLTEANIYLNGIYQRTVPANYRYVLYDACGGTLQEYNVQGFDANQPATLFTSATYDGYKFLGWYTEETGGTKVELLDDSILTGKWLYAHWEAEAPEVTDPTEPSTEPTVPPTEPTEPPTEPTEPPTEPTEPPTEPTEPPTEPTEPPTEPTEPPTEPTEPPTEPTEPPTEPTEPPTEPTEPPTEPTEPPTEPTEPPTEPTEPPTEPTDPSEPETGTVVTVTGTGVNIRSGPGTGYPAISTAEQGQKLTITETATGSGYLWGKFSGGWICLEYTDYDDVISNQDPVEPTVLYTGTVYNASTLNIREKPGTAYDVVGQYQNGDLVEILEVQTVGAVEWGRTDKGWISLTYVKLDSSDNSGDNNNDNTTLPTQTWTGTVSVNDSLWIRSDAGTQYSATGKLTNGTKVTILERKTTDGKEWGRIDKGWICLDYVVLDSDSNTDSGSTTAAWVGTVTVSDVLRIRSGAGSSNSIVGYLQNGDHVTILEEKTVSGVRWGRIDKGWISLDYVKQGVVPPTPDDPVEPTIPTTPTVPTEPSAPTEPTIPETNVSVIMTVNTTSLRIRKGPGITNSITGYLCFGEKVEILETKNAGSAQWGRTATGWINMRYLK